MRAIRLLVRDGRHPWPLRRRVLGVGFGILVVATSAVMAANAATSRDSSNSGLDNVSSLNNVSNRGQLADLLPADQQALQRVNQPGAEVTLLAVRGERAFYRIGSECYGVGPVKPTRYRLGSVKCAPTFPSDGNPVLEFTVFHGDPRAPELTVYRSEGVAADGVAAVGFMTTGGQIVGRTPVIDNVFLVPSSLAGEFRGFVAFDLAGTVISSRPLK